FFIGGAVVGMLGAPRRVRELPEAQELVLAPDAVTHDAAPKPVPAAARRGFAARLAFASVIAAVFVCGGALTAFGGDQFAQLVGGSSTKHVVVKTTPAQETAQWHARTR